MSDKPTYKPARLINGHRCYVVFYAWSEKKQQLVRKRIGVGRLSEEERKELIDEINDLLRKGKTFKNENIGEQKKDTSISYNISFEKGIQIYFSNRVTNKSRYSVKSSMKSFHKILLEYFIRKKLNTIPLKEVKREHILPFLDSLIRLEKSPRTRNNYLEVLKTMFSWLKKRKYCKKNPCKKIPKLTVQEKSHVAYSPEQTSQLVSYLKENDRQLYYFCMFLYYAFLRPNELRQLQVKHIQSDKIMVPGSLSKNEKTQYIIIPDRLNSIIEEMKIRSNNPDWYVFSGNGSTGPSIMEIKSMSRRYLKIKTHFKLGKEYSMYCWKHTGVVNLFLKGFDIKYIQHHCRHSDIRMTDIYLRSLGLFRNDKLKTEYPEV